MRTIYIDITDIVQYSSTNPRVSGIQRVQARLISAFVENNTGNDRIYVSFWNAIEKKMYCCDAAGIFNDPEFDSTKFRVKLGLLQARRFPTRKEVRRALAPHRGQKLKRTIQKLTILFSALFARDRLQQFGIQDYLPYAGTVPCKLDSIESLSMNDDYVILGAVWCNEEIMDFAKSHKQAGGRVFQLIYDLIPYYGPEYFSSDLTSAFCHFLDAVPSFATHYLCISNWTRLDLQQYLSSKGIHADPAAIPLAHEFIGYPRNHTGSKPDNSELLPLGKTPFVLSVGTIEGRKNISTLLKAWEILINKGITPPILVLAGKRGWDSEEIFREMEQNPAISDIVRTIQSPSDRDLAYLYENCLFTLYPSHYEGWGLPVGEAAWFGKYVIASKSTSLPEVCADLIDYIDPKSASSIADAVEYALSTPEHVAKKVAKIRQSNLRKWDEVASQLLSAITTSDSKKLATTSTFQDNNTARSQIARI